MYDNESGSLPASWSSLETLSRTTSFLGSSIPGDNPNSGDTSPHG